MKTLPILRNVWLIIVIKNCELFVPEISHFTKLLKGKFRYNPISSYSRPPPPHPPTPKAIFLFHPGFLSNKSCLLYRAGSLAAELPRPLIFSWEKNGGRECTCARGNCLRHDISFSFFTISSRPSAHNLHGLFQIASRPGAHNLRCLFRVTFVPKDAYELLRKDSVAFEYLFVQVGNYLIINITFLFLSIVLKKAGRRTVTNMRETQGE